MRSALPQHAIIVEFGRRVRHAEIEPAGFDRPVAGIRQCVVITRSPGRWPRPSMHVDLRRPAAVVGEQPERRPDAGADRDLGADLEISVLLRKRALGRQDARDVFIVEQHRFSSGGVRLATIESTPSLNLERVEPERRGCASAVARIDIDLLFAVLCVFALEVGAVAAPVAGLRPGGAAGVVRHPSSARQRMLVEIVMEGPVQRQEGRPRSDPGFRCDGIARPRDRS